MVVCQSNFHARIEVALEGSEKNVALCWSYDLGLETGHIEVLPVSNTDVERARSDVKASSRLLLLSLA